MKIKEACHAYLHTGIRPVCKILTELVCSYKECPFYKTPTQFEIGIIKLNHREEIREKQRELQNLIGGQQQEPR